MMQCTPPRPCRTASAWADRTEPGAAAGRDGQPGTPGPGQGRSRDRAAAGLAGLALPDVAAGDAGSPLLIAAEAGR